MLDAWESPIAAWVPAEGHTAGSAPEKTGPQLPHCLLSCSSVTLRDNWQDQKVKEGWLRPDVKTASKKAIDEYAKGMDGNFFRETQADEMSGKICFVTKEMQTVARLEKTHSPGVF